MVIKDGKARQSDDNTGNRTIFDEVIKTQDVKNKCTEARDQDKTFYIENTYGPGKYECLKKDGNNLIGNHYTATKTFDTEVKYTSLNSMENNNCNTELNKLRKKHELLEKEYNLNNSYDDELNKEFIKKSLQNIKIKMYNDNNQMNSNSQIESFTNPTDSIIEYNKALSEKQKVQQDKLELIKEKEANLIKVNASLKSSNDRNNFKKKIIYTLVALIFFLFLLCLSTYIYFVRDFKVNK